MSLIQSMRDVGRPVAYYPRLARFFGSVNASIFFSQLAYWQDRTENPMGVYKTVDEWEDETGLSYREQATARKHLCAPGYLVETHKRLEHRVYYRLDFDAIDTAFCQWMKRHSPNCGMRTPPSDESAFRGVRIPQSVSKTETTSETTSESKRGEARAQAPAAPIFPKLDFFDAEQAEIERQAAIEARARADRRVAAEQKAAAKAAAAAQSAADEQAKAQVAAKAAKPAKAAVSRATEFPADFAPNETCIELAAGLGVTLDGVDGELARFEDYHAAKGTTLKDWQAGLRTWIRNAAKFARRDQTARPGRAAAQAETFRERDERLARERWEQATGQRHPDSLATEKRFGNVIDITPSASTTFPSIPF